MATWGFPCQLTHFHRNRTTPSLINIYLSKVITLIQKNEQHSSLRYPLHSNTPSLSGPVINGCDSVRNKHKDNMSKGLRLDQNGFFIRQPLLLENVVHLVIYVAHIWWYCSHQLWLSQIIVCVINHWDLGEKSTSQWQRGCRKAVC